MLVWSSACCYHLAHGANFLAMGKLKLTEPLKVITESQKQIFFIPKKRAAIKRNSAEVTKLS